MDSFEYHFGAWARMEQVVEPFVAQWVRDRLNLAYRQSYRHLLILVGVAIWQLITGNNEPISILVGAGGSVNLQVFFPR